MIAMKLTRRHFNAAALAACIPAPMVARAQPKTPIVIKFSHVVAPNASKGKAADYFKKLAEERTKGAVKVEVYPNSTLYKDKEEVEALQLGAVQMLAPTPGKFGPLGVREFEVLDLPYLFSTLEEERKVTQGPVGKALLAKLESKGIHGLGFWDNGFKQFTSNKPLRAPEDFKGQKLRIVSSKVIDAQMRVVGAIPQTLAFSEVYQGLQSGVIDGQENPNGINFTSKIYEVQKYLTMSDHGYHGYAVITNAKFWAGLPPEVRSTLESVMKETSTYFDSLAKQENDDGLAGIKAAGKTEVIALTAQQKLAWKRAFVPVHKEMIPRYGKPMLDDIYKEIGFNAEKA